MCLPDTAIYDPTSSFNFEETSEDSFSTVHIRERANTFVESTDFHSRGTWFKLAVPGSIVFRYTCRSEKGAHGRRRGAVASNVVRLAGHLIPLISISSGRA